MTKLSISRSLLQEVIMHCQRDYPHEACGLLAGKAGRAECVLPMPNAAAEPDNNYLVEGAAQARAFRYMAEKDWELVGIYHSHPHELPIPSRSDIQQAHYSQALHLIVGMRNRGKPDVRAYRLIRETGKAVRVMLDVGGLRNSRHADMLRSRSGGVMPVDKAGWTWGQLGWHTAALPYAGGAPRTRSN